MCVRARFARLYRTTAPPTALTRRCVLLPQGTAEVADHFWRKVVPCVPFEMVVGMPFVVVVIASPDSTAAATLHAYEASPLENTGSLHTFIRLFAHHENVTSPFCAQQDDPASTELLSKTFGPPAKESCYQLNGTSIAAGLLRVKGNRSPTSRRNRTVHHQRDMW